MSAQLARLRRLFNDPSLTASGRKLVPTARVLEIQQPLRALLADLDQLAREGRQFDPATTDLYPLYLHDPLPNRQKWGYGKLLAPALNLSIFFDKIWPPKPHKMGISKKVVLIRGFWKFGRFLVNP